MVSFERTGPLRLEPQLDGSATEAFDCGVAACVMALDDASYGLVRPATEAVRERMGGDRDATNPDQWKAAIDSFADRFAAFGLQPPRTVVVRGRSHADLWHLLHDRRRRVIAALHYDTVASEKRPLWASRSFRGNHAVYLRAAKVVGEGRRVPAYDPLADGRFTGCPNGRRLWPFWLVRAASGNVRDGKGRRLYPGEDRWIGLVVAKARPIGEPDDGVDPGDPDAGDPDLPDATELLEVIADTAGELEDHVAAMSASLNALRPWLPAASENNVFRIARELDAGLMNGIGGKLARTDYYVRRPYPQLEFSFAEFSPTSFPLIVPGATAAPDGTVPEDIIISPPAVRRLGADAYHEWQLRVPGVDGKDVALVIPLGLNVNDAEFTAADSADPTVVRMLIEGRFDPDDDTAPAWTIRLVGAAA